MFSTEHFIWLAVCTALIVAGSLFAIKKKITLSLALTLLCIFCVTSEVVKIFCVLIREERVVEGKGVFIKETDLPFHLCSLQLFFSFIAKFTKNKKVRDFLLTFMMPTCVLGGVAALLIPTITCKFTNPRTYQYFLYHASIIWFAIVVIARFDVDLSFKGFIKTVAGLLTLVFITFYINGFFQNTNFLYLSEPPLDGLPILNMDHGWFVYFLSYMALALVLILLFYAPFWIYQKCKRVPIETPPTVSE